MFTKLNKFLAKEFLYGSHLYSLGASGVVYASSMLVLGKGTSWLLIFITYSIFQFIYLHDRYKHIESDNFTNRERSRHLRFYLSEIPYILTIYLLIVLVGSLVFFNLTSLFFSILIITLGYLYPSFFKAVTKKIHLFKNFYVSVVFSSMVIFAPLYYSSTFYNPTILYVFLGLVFVESFITQAILDFKDVLSDAKEKLLTFPIILGKERAIFILKVSSLTFAVIFGSLALYYNLNFLFFVLVIVSLLINLISLKMIYENKTKGYAISAGKFFVWLLIALVIDLAKI